MRSPALPVAVIGAGPVGLAAAAHLLARGLDPLVLEAGPAVGHAVRAWGHVRMFSPWRFNTDAAARALLEAEGWTAPDPEACPTGAELVERYLAPLPPPRRSAGASAPARASSASPAATMAACTTGRGATPRPSSCILAPMPASRPSRPRR